MRKLTAAVAALLICAAMAPAAVFSVDSSASDASVTSAGNVERVNDASWRVGGSATGVTSCFVFVFQLPALPSGESVVAADLQATVLSTNDWRALYQKGLDIYGVRTAAASTVLATDYFGGAYAATGNNGTGLQQNLVYQPNNYNGGTDPTLAPKAYNTDATGDANLAAWLQGLYDGGAAAGDFAFIRINTDGTLADYRYFVVASGNNVTAADRPTLTIETAPTIPEPASMALLALGGLAMLKRHRA